MNYNCLLVHKQLQRNDFKTLYTTRSFHRKNPENFAFQRELFVEKMRKRAELKNRWNSRQKFRIGKHKSWQTSSLVSVTKLILMRECTEGDASQHFCLSVPGESKLLICLTKGWDKQRINSYANIFTTNRLFSRLIIEPVATERSHKLLWFFLFCIDTRRRKIPATYRQRDSTPTEMKTDCADLWVSSFRIHVRKSPKVQFGFSVLFITQRCARKFWAAAHLTREHFRENSFPPKLSLLEFFPTDGWIIILRFVGVSSELKFKISIILDTESCFVPNSQIRILRPLWIDFSC